MATTPARMQQRRRTAAQWAAENPILAKGEIGLAFPTSGTDAPAMKMGDGVTAWNSMGWVNNYTTMSIASGEMSTSATRITTNRVPRIVLPPTGTTSVFVGPKGFPVWWFTRGLVMGFDWVNDHTATGNVRFRFILQGQDIFSGSIQSPTIVHDETVTIASAAANGGIQTSLINGGNAVTPTPGFFGTLYSFELQRLGDDAADTLAGNGGLCEFVFLAAN